MSLDPHEIGVYTKKLINILIPVAFKHEKNIYRIKRTVVPWKLKSSEIYTMAINKSETIDSNGNAKNSDCRLTMVESKKKKRLRVNTSAHKIRAKQTPLLSLARCHCYAFVYSWVKSPKKILLLKRSCLIHSNYSRTFLDMAKMYFVVCLAD